MLFNLNARLDLHLIVNFFLKNESNFANNQCSYFKIFYASVRRRHHEVVRVIMNNRAKAHINYLKFSWAIKYAKIDKHYAVFYTFQSHMFFEIIQYKKELQTTIALNKKTKFDDLKNIFSSINASLWIHLVSKEIITWTEIMTHWRQMTRISWALSWSAKINIHRSSIYIFFDWTLLTSFFQCTVFTKSWVAQVMKVKQLSDQETAWEETLDLLSFIRSSICYNYVDESEYQRFVLEVFSSSKSSIIDFIEWMKILKTAEYIWRNRVTRAIDNIELKSQDASKILWKLVFDVKLYSRNRHSKICKQWNR